MARNHGQHDRQPGDGNKRAAIRRVQEVLTEMHHTRHKFEAARQAGDLDEALLHEFQAIVVAAYGELRPFREYVKGMWEDATTWGGGLDVLPEKTAPQKVTRVKTVGLGRTEKVTETVRSRIQPHHLLRISYEIDEIATELGYNPSPAEGEKDDISPTPV